MNMSSHSLTHLGLQQWQIYNPLDKSNTAPNMPQSNKFPYSKKSPSPVKGLMLQAKVSSVGICPPRNSMEVDDLNVMMVGSSVSEQTKNTQEIEKYGYGQTQQGDIHFISNEAPPCEQTKMPAIINSEGTTTKPQFAVRAKPPPMPRSTFKSKRKLKPVKDISPTRSLASTTKLTTQESNQSEQSGRSTAAASSARTTSPLDVVKSAISIEITEASSSPVRSIDDMIQTLRSSRQTSGKQEREKSASDQKIDEILQQVMMHAQEWMNDTQKQESVVSDRTTPDGMLDADEDAFSHEQTDIRETKEVESDAAFKELEGSVSDTVSTLASHLSAPAGIPDVSAILARKSSHALREQTSQISETSSPFMMMMHEEEESVDYDQALHDLNMPSNVTIDDILCIKGGHPPLIEKPAVLRQEKDDYAFRTPAELPFSYTVSGKMHRLCLLPSIKELTITPKEFVLSKVLHANSDVDISSHGDTNLEEIQARKEKDETKRSNMNDKNIDQLPSEFTDSSKLDPLDIDGWRRLVEGRFEKEDYTVEGLRSEAVDWAAWRLLWTVVPPKMALSTSAVKALVFPRYHGSQLTADTVTEEESWVADDNLSDIVIEERKPYKHNIVTLEKKHHSLEDLSKISLHKTYTAPSPPPLMRSASMPRIKSISQEESSVNLVRTDYTTAMSDVKRQRESAFQQHIKKDQRRVSIISAADKVLFASDSLMMIDSSESTVGKEQQISSTTTVTMPSKASLRGRNSQRISLATDARAAGRQYVMFGKKRLKSKKKRRLILSVQKTLAAYTPRPLTRSLSCASFLPPVIDQPPVTRASTKQKLPHGKLTRTTSLPRMSDYQWFVARYQTYGQKIEDMREWVRDIWNTWFDEVFPPEEDSAFSEDFEDDHALDENDELRDEVKQRAEIRRLSIPDTIAPEILDSFAGDGSTRAMRAAVATLNEELRRLGNGDTARRACHLQRRGALFRKLGEIKKAITDLNEAIQLEPRLAPAFWQRHLIRLLKNQRHEALDDLNAFLKINYMSIDGYRSRADIYASLGDYTMAVVNYSQAIKLNPTDPEPYFQRASIFEKTGDMLLAMEDYGAVVRLNSGRTDALSRRALFYFSKKSWHSAVSDFSHLVRLEPVNALHRTYRGRAYAALGQDEKALKDLSAAIHLDPLNAVAFYHRGALLRTAAPEKALQDLSTSLLLDDSEKNVLAVLHRGILYSEMKRFSEAMADFEQTLRIDGSIACAHVNIGLIQLLVTENFWEAVRRFTMAVKCDPTYIRTYVCRADALARIHDYKAALCDITRAIHLRPTERHLYLRRGKLLLQLRKLKLAAFCVKHIATLEKGLVASSPTQQAVVESFLGNHTEAVNSINTACRSKPVPHMYVLLSKTLMKGNRFEEAVTNLRHAVELSAFFMYGDSSKADKQATPEAAEMYFLLGQCYTEMHNHKDALTAYNNALKVNSNYAEAYYQRGLCRLKLDQPKGVQDLNRALALQPDLFEAYLSRAAFYGTNQRYSKAILNCNEALRLRPRSVRALLCRGSLKYHISAYHHAITDLTEAIELDNQCALAYYNRAVCLHKSNQHHQALKDYSIVLVLSADEKDDAVKSLRSRVFVNRALLYLNSDLQDARNAALDLEQAAILSPNDTSILHTMALCYHKLQDLEGAHSAYTRCLEVDPSFLTAYVGRGDAYGDAGRFEEAKFQYERALRLDPSYVDARVHLAYNLQMCGQLQQAWVHFTAAISAEPTCQSALEGRAVTCLHAGDLDAASRDLSTAMEGGKPTARLLTACGVVHQCQHDLFTAMAYYNKARKLDPAYTPAHFNAAVLYMRERRFTDALECLDIVIRKNPDDSAALLNRAISRVFLKDVEAAMSDFTYALHLDPYNAHIYYNKANLHFMLKDYKNAENGYTAAFDIDPSDYLSLKRRADARGRLGLKESAVEDYRQSLIIFEQHERLKKNRGH